VNFHEVMKSVKAKVNYSDEEILVGLKNPKFADMLIVADALKTEFGVEYEDIEVCIVDSHISMVISFKSQNPNSIHEEEVDEVQLSDKVSYKVENGELILKYRHKLGSQNLLRVNMEDIYTLYEELPDRADKDVIHSVAEKLGIKIPESVVGYVMRFFEKYPVFDAVIDEEGRKIYLVKRDGEYSEMKSKLQVEKDVIGTPWKV